MMAERILLMIVDDDADDRWFFVNAVNSLEAKYQCIEAQDGIDALEKLETATLLPSYIFLDLNMPRMGGKECLAAIKKNPALTNIPVIIYSTSNYQKDVAYTASLGAVYYLTKEVDLQKLAGAINAALRVSDIKARHISK